MTLTPANPNTSVFESIRRARPDGSEFWSARDLQAVLGYDTWRNFTESMERARAACDNSGQDSRDHFVGASKMIEAGKGATRDVLDHHLTRYACYLTAMNGDPRKAEIAAAQTYFTVQTRRAELATPALPASPLTLARQMLESLEAQETRVSAIEYRLDTAPITSEKVGTIYKLGQQLGQVMGDYRRAWRLFKDRFGLASYRDLPSNQYEEGVRFLRLQIRAYTGNALLGDAES
ncbi:BRO family protein [Deinococcus marmoris]|uniref:BRO family protein n=1 Tax=Deinococcus marmoris TaxID=249408 RepID=UPI000691E376|nr:BRO family protein [Deinococcus marmoris]